jgi:uncharacterized protein involved in exopolysaccharide biosynthesis
MQENQNYESEYYEIDLMDYVKVLFKRRRMLFVIIGLSIFCGLVYNSFCFSSFKTESILKPGRVGETILEDPEETIAILEQRSTLKKVLDNMEVEVEGKDKVKKLQEILAFEKPKDINLIVIKAENGSSDIAIQSAQASANLIIERHESLFEKREEALEEKINNKKEEISTYREDLEDINKQIEILERNTNYLEGQGLALQGYLESLRSAQEKLDNAKDELASLELQKVESRNTEIVASAADSLEEMQPRVLLTLSISGFLGLFIGIFGVFFVEWWEDNKDKLETN